MGHACVLECISASFMSCGIGWLPHMGVDGLSMLSVSEGFCELGLSVESDESSADV